jgi:ribose transport system permease protein
MGGSGSEGGGFGLLGETGVGLEQLTAYAIIVGLVVASAIVFPGSFYTQGNLRALAIRTAGLGIVALGQMLVLLIGCLDMSVSAVVLLVAVLGVAERGWNPGWLVLTALAASAAIGLVNGLLVVKREVPPFIATFGMLILVGGVEIALTHGVAGGEVPAWMAMLGSGQVGGLPIALLLWLVLSFVCGLTLSATRYGWYVYAVGSGLEAARFSGLRVDSIRISCFVACALLAAIGGFVMGGYVKFIDQSVGATANLDSIAAAVIGGTAFAGGRGGVVGTAAGVILISLAADLVVVAGLPVYWEDAASGAILLVAIMAQRARRQL